MTEVLSAVMLLLGAAFCLVSAVGVARFSDLYARMHASTKAGTLGAGLLVAAGALVVDDGSVALRAVATIAFVFLTAPIAAHAIAGAAYRSGQARPRGVVDELRDFESKSRAQDPDR